jgi:hypothetical protein
MLLSLNILSQGKDILTGLPVSGNDTTKADTLKNLLKISKDAIDLQVTYAAPGGYIVNDVAGRTATLVKNAIVKYGDIEIKADSIIFNMSTNHVFAVGVKDSVGKVVGKPEFKQGSQSFTCDSLEYNFRTKKAVIKNIITQQDEGLLHSTVTKLLEDGTSNIFKSTYSTCPADTPHFYINLKKAKVYPGKKIISGPGNLVILGVPLPLYIPFGYFPIQKKRAASGILFPKAHFEATRGYGLTDGGYYFAINDYFDLTLKSEVFSNGSWLASVGSNYNRLYKYSGILAFSFADNISGHRGLSDFSESKNYSLRWSFNQSAKAAPGSRFSASVNMSSSGYDKSNSYNLTDHITTTKSSSISYSKSWDGTPLNLSISANHSQNSSTKKVNMDLPNASFTASRIYPFRNLGGATKKWYQDLQFQYSAEMRNTISTTDTAMFTGRMFRDMRSGFTHSAPLSFQIRPFRNFSITPSVSYKGVLFTQKILQTWDPDSKSIKKDTIRGTFYGQAFNPTISAGYSPQIFGFFSFKHPKPNARLEQVRHVMKPSVSFGYTPYLSGLSSKMFRQVQGDTTGKMMTYSIYDGNLFQPPSLASRSGNVSFGLANILEAKVYEKNDTTGKPKKITLIDNFNFSTSYNIFADSMKWSPIAVDFHTSLFSNINFNASSHFSLYGLSGDGKKVIGSFYYNQTGKLMRLTDASASLNFSVDRLFQGKNKKKTQAESKQKAPAERDENAEEHGTENLKGQGANEKSTEFDEYGFAMFDSPWTMSVSYSFLYSKPLMSPSITQAISINGTLQLTKKMNITYATGYDIKHKAISMTQIGVTRDLHCWDMSFNWVPNGYMKMWEFSIKVKASVLQDLKYERRKDYHDNY